MKTSTVTANSSGTTCSGYGIQVSRDGFSNCVQMSATPTSTNFDSDFLLTPQANLDNETWHKIRVSTSATDLAGNSLDQDASTAGNQEYTMPKGFKTADISAPVLTEVTRVTTPSNDASPDYVFKSNEAGTLSFPSGTSCSSNTGTSVTANVNKTATLKKPTSLDDLDDGTYSDCLLKVADSSSNVAALSISTFVIDSTGPVLISKNPVDNASSVSLDSSMTFQFDERVDASTVSVNSADSACTGSIQVSDDNFSTGSCVQMSAAPQSAESNKVFTIRPAADLAGETTYEIKITTAVKDTLGTSMAADNVSSFRTADRKKPVISLLPFTDPTNDPTLEITIRSDEGGTISFSDTGTPSCGTGLNSDNTTNVTAGDNRITYQSLPEGRYTGCRVKVTDNSSNASDPEAFDFTIDLTKPTIAEVTPVSSPTKGRTCLLYTSPSPRDRG